MCPADMTSERDYLAARVASLEGPSPARPPRLPILDPRTGGPNRSAALAAVDALAHPVADRAAYLRASAGPLIPALYGPAPTESEVWTGEGYFDLSRPSPTMVPSLGAIAETLAGLARFNRRTSRFYSVAEHSILCDDLARDFGLPARLRRAVLMHDAAEAIMGDAIRPLKAVLPAIAEVEAGVAAAIFERFDIPIGFSAEAFDLAALAIEKRDLLPVGLYWPGLPEPGERRAPMLSPERAALDFLIHAAALDIR